MPNPVVTVTPEHGLRYHGCGLCRGEVPSGCYVSGTERDGALVGVRAWADGTCEDGKPGLVVAHECGEAPDMDDPTSQHHATLRGEAPPNPGVS